MDLSEYCVREDTNESSRPKLWLANSHMTTIVCWHQLYVYVYEVIKKEITMLIVDCSERIVVILANSRQSLDHMVSIPDCHPTTHQLYQGASGWCFASMARWHQPENCAQMDSFATCQHRSGSENQESPWEETHFIFSLKVFRGSNSLIQTNLAIKNGDFFDFSDLLPKGLPHWVTPDVVQFGSHHHGLPGLSSDQTWLVSTGMHGISQTKSFDAPLKWQATWVVGSKAFNAVAKQMILFLRLHWKPQVNE